MIKQLIEEEAKKYSTYSKYGTERYWSEASGNGIQVRLDLTITDDLLEEGVLNEVIRQVNSQRKVAGLNVSDRIELFCPIEFRQSFLEQIKNDCLCDLTWFTQQNGNKFVVKIGKIDVEMSWLGR